MKQEMTWDSRDWNYHGVTSDGREILVSGDEYAESEQDAQSQGVDQESIDQELGDPDGWATCVGANQNVWYR